MEYIYHGDKATDSLYRKMECKAVRLNGKCIRGKNSNMLVEFYNGDKVVVMARMLRKIKMNSFQRFMDGLDWGEETLLEQRERLAKSVLSEKEMQEREKLILDENVTKECGQLKLF